MTRAQAYAAELLAQHQAQNQPPIRGLGDAVARVTSALGVPQCAPCGERQDRLNQLWPFGARK